MIHPSLLTAIMFGIVFGVVSAVIAASKDRSVTGFFFLGFFLPLIGLIVAILAQSYRTSPVRPVHAPPPQVGPAGWFADPDGSGGLRWFDGWQWGWQTAPAPTPPPSLVQPAETARADFPATTAPPQYRVGRQSTDQ